MRKFIKKIVKRPFSSETGEDVYEVSTPMTMFLIDHDKESDDWSIDFSEGFIDFWNEKAPEFYENVDDDIFRLLVPETCVFFNMESCLDAIEKFIAVGVPIITEKYDFSLEELDYLHNICPAARLYITVEIFQSS